MYNLVFFVYARVLLFQFYFVNISETFAIFRLYQLRNLTMKTPTKAVNNKGPNSVHSIIRNMN